MPAQARGGGLLRAGERVGRFRVGWLVGIGATSEVYVATDERQRRDVVLKLISVAGSAQDELRRLQREVAVLAAARHPNVLRVYECGQLSGRAYLITDFAEGGSLEMRLRGTRAATPEAMRLLTGMAAGLDHIHALGIVHGDVKPANVLLTSGARPLLADFGIARLPSQYSGVTQPRHSAHPLGTPLYMSPEQVRNEGLTPASDVYSTAVVAYQLLSGRLPFEAEVSADVMYMHLTATATPASAVGPNLPPALDDVLAKGMAKSPDDRWSRCSEMVAAITTALAAPAPAVATEERSAANVPPKPRGRLIAKLLPRYESRSRARA